MLSANTAEGVAASSNKASQASSKTLDRDRDLAFGVALGAFGVGLGNLGRKVLICIATVIDDVTPFVHDEIILLNLCRRAS